MGPFGKLHSKLKGQQKEPSKNGKHGSDSRSDSQKEHDEVLSSFKQERVESKAEDDDSRPVHRRQILKTSKLDDKAEQKGAVGTVQASNCTDVCLPKEPCGTMEKGTRKPQDDSTAVRNETALVKSEQVGAGDAKIKRSWKDSRYNLNVQKSFEAFACIASPGKKVEGRLEEEGENKTKVPATVHKTEGVVHESSDLDSSSLSLSLGLNRIKTRSGPLYKDGTEGENEAILSESKTLKGDKAMPSVERSDKSLHQRSQLESLVHKELGDVGRSKFETILGNWDGEHCKTSTSASYSDADLTSKISQGKMRRKSKAESQRPQRGHSGRSPPDQTAIPMVGQVFNSSNFVASTANEKVGTERLSAQELSKVPLKSDAILEKKVPSSLLSYLNNEFDESFDVEIAGKQLDVIKEAESPTFRQPTPQVTQNRIHKKWPKDIKSFSHELGPRGGRPHDVHRPHSDNDLEELLAALRARFNTAKEEVDAELKFFASDLIEILDRNTDSFPEWKENVEDLLVLAQRCTELSPVDFRRECESIVHELDERRQELPMGLLKQLHTRMLFILTRCTRLLQFQKETSPEEEGLHKIQQCLKGVPSVERTLSSGPSKRGKGTATTKKLLPEVLEQSARSDAGLLKLKISKHTRKHRFALEKGKLKNQQPCSPKIVQSDANRLVNLKKSCAVSAESFEVSDPHLYAKGSATKACEERAVTQVQGTWDQTEGKLADVDLHLVSAPSKHAQKAPWLNWTDSEKEEPELVICRICEEEVRTSHLEPHSLRCTLADACDVQGVNLDERLRMLADNLEKIAELNTPKSNQMAADESPDGFRPFKLNSHDGSDNASPQSNDLQGKAMDGRLDDMCVSDTVSVEDLRGLSLINFKRLLGGKTDQGVASSSAGSGTPRSTLTTPRTSQLDLLWAERNSFAELEDTSQIYELAGIARDIASKSPMEEGVLDSLGSCFEELHEILARNKIAALTVDTFGRRIQKLLREKIYLFGGAGDMRKFDSLSGSFEDDGMSTDDGVQSFKSTPTHPSYNDRITIEDFDILKLISRGAFGRVFLAKKRATGDLFAIKVLRKIDMIRKNAVENILAERDILITVCNPFVVRFFYSFTCRDNLYLVMEYLNGGDLYSFLRNMGCLDEHVARVYIAELVLALEYLHSLGVVHRDLKPDNILIAHDGHIKLTDFGLSKVGLINSTDDLSAPANGAVLMEESMFENCGEHVMQRECRKERSAVGTPDYLAPEILLGAEHGCTADWWSVGVILFECVTGVPPFNAEHPQIIFDNILNRKIPWPHIPEDMSYDAKDLIDKLLTEDPNQRLGAKGAPEVKSHPFFKDISWDNLARQKAAFVPSPESVDDTSYFTSRHLEGYANSSPRFGDSSDCSTSCSSSNSMKAILNEREDECGDLADFQRSPSVERTFNNFSFKNASQLAYMNYDIVSQTGRDASKGHSRHLSAS